MSVGGQFSSAGTFTSLKLTKCLTKGQLVEKETQKEKEKQHQRN
jgi:hypothetical protein